MDNAFDLELKLDIFQNAINNSETVDDLEQILTTVDQFEKMTRDHIKTVKNLVVQNNSVLHVHHDHLGDFEFNQLFYERKIAEIRNNLLFQIGKKRLATIPNVMQPPSMEDMAAQMSTVLSQMKVMQENFIQMFGTMRK